MVRELDADQLVGRARNGDRRALARMISHVEDRTPVGAEVLSRLYLDAGRAFVTGLTGAPGAGKSTLTDRLISEVRGEDREVAVVAVDPSSPFTGGAILGDRVRMQNHVDDRGVYIRSLASRGHLGGISAATPRVITVLDGLGFPEIIVETVGVGQAEVDIAADADTTIVVVNPGWGDAIQAAKAGLLEIGDIFVVNKADRPSAAEAVRDLKQMLELGPPKEWRPPVLTTVATTGEGVHALWLAVREHRTHLQSSGELRRFRERRITAELDAAIGDALQRSVADIRSGPVYERMVAAVVAREIDPWRAAEQLAAGGG